VVSVASKAFQSWLPEPFLPYWKLFFPEFQSRQVGVTHDYTPPPAWRDATRRLSPAVRLGPSGQLQHYVAGAPFPLAAVDCEGDPNAGLELAYDMSFRWKGDGGRGTLRVSELHRGKRVGPTLQASLTMILLAHRVEPNLLASSGGTIFRGEKRSESLRVEITDPQDQRGTRILRYRYRPSLGKPDDLWVGPAIGTPVHLRGSTWPERLGQSELVLQDLDGFVDRVSAYRWRCLGEQTLLGAVRTDLLQPLARDDPRWGPSGLAVPPGELELRRALHLRAIPRDPAYPYGFRDFWIDTDSFEPLYFAAYDRSGSILRLGVQTSAWSGDSSDLYPGWPGIPEPRDLYGVAWLVENTQLGTGVRYELWDRTGLPMASKGRIGRAVDWYRHRGDR